MVIGRGVFTLLTGLKKYSCLSCNFGANLELIPIPAIKGGVYREVL